MQLASSDPPSQEPGPWCGSFIAVKDGCLYAYVSQEKWIKAKTYIEGWYTVINRAEERKESPIFDHKQLERGRGFLVYLSRTYTSIVPYLKGIHLTLDSWREGRDLDGWKLKSNARRSNDEEDKEEKLAIFVNRISSTKDTNLCKLKAPKLVKGVSRLASDLEALNKFFKTKTPPWRFIRGRMVVVARYGFGDASKAGFGSTIETEEGLSYRYGTWGSDGEDKSSNFRELENLAQCLEEEIKKGVLHGAEIFIFTDNSTAESGYYKGTSSSKPLFEIVLRLRKLEFAAGVKIHFIHVAGSRMIEQGTDGLSRGDLGEGVMKGAKMLEFVPLHLTAFDRSERLKHWLVEWISPSLRKGEKIEILDESDWFWRGHDISSGKINDDGVWIPEFQPGIYIWKPAPASAQIAIEQLREARNERTSSIHIVLIPRLFTSIWRRQLTKAADLFITLPDIDGVWTKSSHHEPLTLAFIFPFISRDPWQLKRTTAFLEMDRYMRSLWNENQIATGFILCQFLVKTRNLETMSKGLVCRMLLAARHFRLFHHDAGK